MVSEALGLEKAIADSDLVLTGEGRYDAQTLHGKVVGLLRSFTSSPYPYKHLAGVRGAETRGKVWEASGHNMRRQGGHTQGIR